MGEGEGEQNNEFMNHVLRRIPQVTILSWMSAEVGDDIDTSSIFNQEEVSVSIRMSGLTEESQVDSDNDTYLICASSNCVIALNEENPVLYNREASIQVPAGTPYQFVSSTDEEAKMIEIKTPATQ